MRGTKVYEAAEALLNAAHEAWLRGEARFPCHGNFERYLSVMRRMDDFWLNHAKLPRS